MTDAEDVITRIVYSQEFYDLMDAYRHSSDIESLAAVQQFLVRKILESELEFPRGHRGQTPAVGPD